ncbi:aldo/keto reductase [Bacillaceae bacterium SIJ1]|uniref:aldo/keto reductase n=1 Tax=Litoribacterium kuwaitense TaxID=1398745 RepID=UPI0013EE2886|nr:aldo/keto reductase [Litoribacterium kuwaitense]NGP43638.1 aldo/keto reductase [Litoribacterium kuwaitense]
MKERNLGQSELSVSTISYGCMSLGTDVSHAESLLAKAVDLGITHFDTADLYDQGLNEELVGRILKPYRKDITIATKVGNRFTPGEQGWTWAPTKEYILQQVDESLRRLQTDYIDLYQLHGGTMDDPIDEIIEAFEMLQQKGKIRAYGISSIRPNVIQTYVEKANIASVMMQYSLLDRRPEEWLDYLHDNGVSVIARGPLAKGLLATNGHDKRKHAIRQEGYLSYDGQELQTTLSQLENHFPSKLTAASLQYVLHHPAVACVIPGASKLEQLTDIAKTPSVDLTDDDIKFMKQLTKEDRYKNHRER